MDYLTLKVIHILSSTLLFGTGLGTAFFMFMTKRSRNLEAISVVSRYVVLADWLFTSPTVIIQPLTGLWLVHLAGFPWQSSWLMLTFMLYTLAACCWLPVVWLQLRMRDMAQEAVATGTELPACYWRYERRWTLLGIPAFFALVAVYALMVFKPS